LCKCRPPIVVRQTNYPSRTYGGNEGEDIREGFEPADSSAVVDPKEGQEEGSFAVGEDDHDGESPGTEESREWKKTHEPEVLLKPKYGVEGEEFENVWGGEGPSEPPKENP
jgi:hypothetical protein